CHPLCHVRSFLSLLICPQSLIIPCAISTVSDHLLCYVCSP
ncbi:unnamed protein product, partial [Staurois parvus]